MASPTVNDVERLLIGRYAAWMGVVGMSTAVSTSGTPNPDTLGAIAQAMDDLKYPIAAGTFAAPADADVAAVPKPYLLGGLAGYRLLEAIVGNWTEVTESVQSRSRSDSDLLRAAQDRLAMLAKQYARFLAGPLVPGTIQVRSAARERAAEI